MLSSAKTKLMFDALIGSPKGLLANTFFLMFSGMEAWLIYLSVEPGAASFLKYFWEAYAVSWLLVGVVFGGIHNAPAWSFIPTIAIAVLVQNTLIILLALKVVAALRKRLAV